MPLLFLLLLAGGCSSAISAGHNTALEGADLVAMTDDMAAKIVASQAVQRAYAQYGPLSVVVQPVENYMTAEILPRGAGEAFSARVRTLLSKHAPDRFAWVMNRDSYLYLRGHELDPGPAPESIQPHYALTAKFYSLTGEDRHRRSAAYLCTYELTNLVDRSLLWTGSYEVKKVAVKGFLD